MNDLEKLLNELDSPAGGIVLEEPQGQQPAPQAVEQPQQTTPANPTAPAAPTAPVYTTQGQMNYDIAAARLNASQQQQAAAPTAPQEEPADLRAFREEEVVLTDAQKKMLEEGGVGELIARTARKELNEGLLRQSKHYLDEINKLKADNEKLRQSMTQSRANNFQTELHRLIPDFQEILTNPSFREFGAKTTFDPNYAGPVSYYTLLNNAYNAQNVGYIDYIIKEWRKTQTPAQPAPTAAPQNNEPRPVRATPGQGFQPTPTPPMSGAGTEQRLRQQWKTFNEKLDAAAKSGELKNPEIYAKYNKTLQALSNEATRLNINLA